MTTKSEYNQVIQGFPSYRVFIAGFEVTEDCPDVTSTWVNGRVPSFINLTLLNPNDRYIIRRDDMVALYSNEIMPFINQAQNSDLAKLYKRVVTDGQIVLDSVNDPKSIKSRMRKLKENPVFRLAATVTDPFTGAPSKETLSVYPFIEGKAIFHQNDPVRVFVQDPFDPPVWYYWFSGSVTQLTDGVQGATLEKTLNIQCEDATKSLRYARFSVNPAYRDPTGLSTSIDLKALGGVFTSALANKGFQEAMDYVVFGDIAKHQETGRIGPLTEQESNLYIPVPVVDRRTGNSFNRLILKTAAGNFKPLPMTQRVFTLAKSTVPGRSEISLQNWQNTILDHKVKIEDIQSLRVRSDNQEPTSKVVTRLEDTVNAAKKSGDYTASMTRQIITEIGSDPSNYPVDGGTLYMLLPEGLDKLGNDVVARDFVSSFSAISEFKDRRSLLYDLVDRVEFCVYADPKGNIVIEFPLYDFDPDDFASPVEGRIPANVDPISAARFTIANLDGSYTFDNKRRFTIEDETLENFNATDDDAAVRTISTTGRVVSRAFAVTDNGSAQNPINVPVVVRLDALIAIYGPRQMHGEPKIPVETERSALIAAAIALNKTNAEAYTYKLPLLPRFSAWLNRPMLFKYRNHIATVTSINHAISWGASASSTLSFNYARGWAGKMDSATGKLIYTPIGGKSSHPIDYATLFAHAKVPNNRTPGPGASNP